MQARRKVLFGALIAVLAAAIAFKTSHAWDARIATIGDPTSDSSALTRLLVWQWTFTYSLTHPFGGGFETFIIDHIVYPTGESVIGRAFHSVYFEMLGEQGWVGLGLFLGIAGSSFMALRRARRTARQIPELAWCADLAGTLQISLVVLMACGSFIGIAFQPWFYYLFAISVSVSQYVHRVTTPKPVPAYLSAAAQRAAIAGGGGLAATRRALQAEPSAAGTARTSNLRTVLRPGTSRY
jgi:probable O-glycosylation ligase (exosortase A-associated)